ncbi:ABC transporter permease [Actinoplanes sp. NPDC024001]|uniref:ABC transporter permease n=1 Tax=Actinoplanes sp. NPDC024001 TaxID=3154598 RepID=UPI00340C773A
MGRILGPRRLDDGRSGRRRGCPAPKGRLMPHSSAITAATASGSPSGAHRSPTGAMLHAEWTKFRTTPGMIWLLLIAIAATVTVSVLAISTADCPQRDCGVSATLTGVRVGQAVIAIVAVLVIGDEYRTGMIRTTLVAMPRRTGMLAAKVAVVSAVLTVASATAVLGSFVAGLHLLPGRDLPALSLTEGEVIRAFGGSILYLTMIGLLGVGVTVVLRSPAAAIGSVLGLLYVFPIVAAAVPDQDWERRLQQIGPMDAGLAIQRTGDLTDLPVQPWHGLGVVALWAVAALLTAAVLLHRRDA